MVDRTEADAIAGLAQKAFDHAQLVRTSSGREFVFAPQHLTRYEVTDEYGLKADRPQYIHQIVMLQTKESLIDYLHKFKTESTMLFANIENNAIVAQVDYHSPEKADYIAHRAVLDLPLSQEWLTWVKINNQLLGQLAFARFIEENAQDIHWPEPAELLEAVRDLQAHRKVNFTRAVRTQTNAENFEYTTETNATTRGGIELPTRFTLLMPVYFNEPAIKIDAFLRWSIDQDKGTLSLGFTLHRLENVRQNAFAAIAHEIADQTQCVEVFGHLR